MVKPKKALVIKTKQGNNVKDKVSIKALTTNGIKTNVAKTEISSISNGKVGVSGKLPINRTHSDLNLLDFASQSKSSRGNLWNLKITCWNVDGLRACVKKNGLDFLSKEKPDVMCLQEIKSESHKIPLIPDLEEYSIFWSSAKKAGYSGTGVASKQKPINVTLGIGLEDFDQEGRVVTAEYPNFYLVTVYVPNAGSKLVRLDYRLEWDEAFRNYLVGLDVKKPVVACGDFNVAHQEIDLKNPKTNRRNAGFTQEERDSFTQLLGSGFTDTFRHLYPDLKDQYTYWSYKFNARTKNIGWRLDYFLVSNRLLPHVCDNVIRKDIYGSDHCPITLLLDMDN